jgi:tyrosyl-tRNA synthetase
MVSELPPDKWNECVLWPQYGTTMTIFGSSQIVMGREHSIGILDALIRCGLCESNGEGRKAIKNNGIKINRKPVTDFKLVLTKEHALPNIDAIVLEFGKHNVGIIELC